MKLSRKNHLSRGFTLIELMVVVLILAVLAALVAPRLLGAQDQAKVAAAKADISSIGGMLQRFRLDTDRFPASEEGVAALSQQPSDADGWKGPYTEKDITNDPWGTPYEYTYPGPMGEDTYLIRSYGKDRQANTDDDITNLDI